MTRCSRTICSVTLLVASLIPTLSEARLSTAVKAPDFRIIPRSEWGADESWGLAAEEQDGLTDGETAQSLSSRAPETLTERQRQCTEAYKAHPEDFETDKGVITVDGDGKPLVWPRRYSLKVKDIIIHHTGEEETAERLKQSGTERVRAIYKSHTTTQGWGDIGYHYVIDEEGNIYEGRAGGDRVVGAHAYCANVGTIGVALIGNFLYHYPSPEQLKSLRWLLIDLTKRYDLDPAGSVDFQGAQIPTITGHRDHVATQCPGRKLYTLIPSIRSAVERGDFTSPLLSEKESESGKKKFYTPRKPLQGFQPIGSTTITLPPGGAARLQLRYESADRGVKAGERFAAVERSERSIGLWHQRGDERIRVSREVIADRSIDKGSSALFDFTILAPREAGTYELQIDAVTFTLEVQGRRTRNR